MNVTKFKLEDFVKSAESINVDEVILLEECSNENIPMNDEIQSNKEELSSQADIALDEEQKVEPPLECAILAQNQYIDTKLAELRNLIIDLEKRQNEDLVEISKNAMLFCTNLIKKIFSDSKFSSVIQDVVISKITQILSQMSEGMSVNIKLPKFNEEVKDKIIASIQKATSKLKIELQDNESETDKVEVSWQSGHATIEMQSAIDDIEKEIHKIDTIS